MWPVVAMAALGAAKYYGDQKRAEKDRQLQAETARYSPWTGLAPGQVKEADAFGTIGSGAMSGMQLQQGMDANDAQKSYQDKMLENQAKYNSILEQQGGGMSQGPMMSYQYPQPDPYAQWQMQQQAQSQQSPWLMVQK